jgi:hypothetical protein
VHGDDPGDDPAVEVSVVYYSWDTEDGATVRSTTSDDEQR